MASFLRLLLAMLPVLLPTALMAEETKDAPPDRPVPTGGALLERDAGGADPLDRIAERARKIHELLGALSDADPTVRGRARRELREMGPDVLPFLVEHLREEGLLDHARLLTELEEEASARRPLDLAAFEKQLPAPGAAEKGARRPLTADRYVYAKYNEAVVLYRKREYGRARDLADALIVAEPKSPLRPRLAQLRRYADYQLTRRELLVATLVPEKGAVEIGDDIRMKLTFENVSPSAIRIDFGPPGPAGRGTALGDVVATMRDPLGLRRSAQGSVKWPLPGEIVIPPRGRWEQPVVVEANSAEEDGILDPAYLRVYEIGARLVAVRLWVGDARESRRIETEVCTVRAFPRGVAWRDPDPLAGLGKTLDDVNGTTLNDLYLAAMRVQGPDADKAAGLLVRALPRFLASGCGPVRQVIMECLGELTGLDHGYDVKKWLDWGKVELKPPGPPEGEGPAPAGKGAPPAAPAPAPGKAAPPPADGKGM